MSDKLSKFVQWFLYLLLGLSAIMGVLFYTNTEGNIELFLYWGYFLFILVLATTVLVAAMNVLQNPKGSVKLLIALALMAIIFFISYSVSTNTFTPAMLEKMDTSATTVRFVGAGLFILYVMGVGAIAVILYTTVAKLFK